MCQFTHIPLYLHQNGRGTIPEFDKSEELYHRSNLSIQHNPPYTYFNQISRLIELSTNRSGIENSLSKPHDVLLNSISDIPPIYEGYHVICFSLLCDFPIDLKLEYSVGLLNVIHDPLACNYSHCIFRLTLDNDIIDYENFT